MNNVFVFNISIDNGVRVSLNSVVCMANNEKDAEIIIRNKLEKTSYDNVEVISVRKMNIGEIFIS